MSESDWQKEVCRIAEENGWEWVHFRSERTRRGHSPVIVGTLRKGWPDLILVRLGRAPLAIELKADGKFATPEQIAVLKTLGNAGFRTFIWQPSDQITVEMMLK